ncbi:MAG TPA: tetratricopeptide repeat protein, partial [Candidatus Krumholzibacteria bacterium]|nr:tetratricopeptide repeat protein [Candidatus Krumholzibacteria bacterium]
ALDAATKEVATAFADQPEVEASMRATLGEAYLGLGRLEPAAVQVARAVEINAARGDVDPQATAALELLDARLATAQNDYPKAADLATTAVRRLERTPAVPPVDLVRARQYLAQSLLDAQRFAEADSVMTTTEALTARLEGKDRLFAAEDFTMRASLRELRDGDMAAADSLSREACAVVRAIDPDDPHLAVYMSNAAQYHSQSGDLEGALADFDAALEVTRKQFGEDHPQYATCLENRGGVLYMLGRPDETLASLEEVYAIRARNLGPDHIDAIRTRLNVGTVAMLSGDSQRALDVYRELEPRLIAARGLDHPDVLTLLRNEGIALRALGHPDQALALYERTLEIAQRMYGDDHPRTGMAEGDCGMALMDLDRDDEARLRLVSCFDISLAKLGADNPRTVVMAKQLVALADKLGDEALAGRYLPYTGQ